MTTDLDWNDMAKVVIQAQEETAVYINGNGAVVIRQSGGMEDDHVVIIVGRDNLRMLIRALEEILGKNVA